jgi:DNA repair exonuclease SbcCD nuclease subunit
MSKILFIGDPHIRHTHLSDGVKLLRWLEETIETTNPDIVVNLGDTFDLHSTLRLEVLNEVTKHIDIVCESLKKPMVMVLGNHDMWKPSDSRYHALQIFNGRHKNLYIADSHLRMDGISYVPYLHNNQWPAHTESLVATHNTFIGADYGHRKAQDGIDSSGIQVHTVVSGHIHKRQSLDSSRVIFPGTPMALSASDVNETKGLLVLDSITHENVFIPSPFPIWRSVVFNTGDGDIRNLVNTHDHWIITIKGPRAEVKSILNSKDINDLRLGASVTFRTEITDNVKVDRVSIKTSNIYDMVDQYLEKVYSGSQDKDCLRVAVRTALESTK